MLVKIATFILGIYIILFAFMILMVVISTFTGPIRLDIAPYLGGPIPALAILVGPFILSGVVVMAHNVLNIKNPDE